jgi:hypothetical protein
VGKSLQVWKLPVEENAAVSICDDGNETVLFQERIDVADFPEPAIKLYSVSNVILLPSEY